MTDVKVYREPSRSPDLIDGETNFWVCSDENSEPYVYIRMVFRTFSGWFEGGAAIALLDSKPVVYFLKSNLHGDEQGEVTRTAEFDPFSPGARPVAVTAYRLLTGNDLQDR